ncbi:MAG: aspartyl/asparaginyl beta-hydroxylase domain-containing protein [Gammaproteobacteria bacterium]|jgi:beta-hydroxylase
MTSQKKRFYDLAEFPAISDITLNWESIRDEVESLPDVILDIDRVNKSHEQVYDEMKAIGQNGWLKGWNTDGQANEKWLTYPIRFYDTMVFNIKDTMPKTSQLVESLKGVRVCALNKMRPDLFLGTHEHPDHRTRGTLLYHLCLTMEQSDKPFNYLNVDGEFVQQLPGKAYIFDGSLPHFALNASLSDRTIMYIEFYQDKIANSGVV